MTALIIAILLKHFVCDFPLQADPWMYKNKGTYGHLGGIYHAAVHAAGMIMVLAYFWPVGGLYVLFGAIADGIAHYHIDWAKMNINARMGWRPDNSEWFWMALGVDQLLHYLTYVAIIAAMPN